MMIGVYFLAIFFGGLISGRLGSLYDHWSATNFWLVHAGIVGAAGLLFPVLGKSLRRVGGGTLLISANGRRATSYASKRE